MPPAGHSSHHPLRISPRELVFKVPLDRVSTALLKLHNIGQSPIVYKVKTTAPERYCVRPNNGSLSPGETIEVQVLLNYVKDAPVTLETQDKFQIQSIVLTGPILGNLSDVREAWGKASPEQITKQKLRSKFVSQGDPKALAPISSTPQDHQQHESHTTTTTSTTIPTTIIPTTTITTAIPTTTHPQPHDDTPQTTSQLHTSQSSLSTSQSSSIHASPPAIQPTLADTKPNTLGDSVEQHQYLTPTIGPLILEAKARDATSNLPTLDRADAPPKDLVDTIYSAPKQTGDYVVDTVANFSQLRKTLEQVASLKAEREGILKDNQRLNEQVKTMVEQLQRARDEGQSSSQPTLRQRPNQTPAPLPSNLTTSRPDPQQMFIQIQTKVLLFVVLFFSVIGFLLGRFTH